MSCEVTGDTVTFTRRVSPGAALTLMSSLRSSLARFDRRVKQHANVGGQVRMQHLHQIPRRLPARRLEIRSRRPAELQNIERRADEHPGGRELIENLSFGLDQGVALPDGAARTAARLAAARR